MKLIRFDLSRFISKYITIYTNKEKLKQVITTPLYVNAFYLMTETATSSIIGFFFWIIVARFYTDIEVGYSSAIISAITFLGNLCLFGFNLTLIRFISQARKPQDLINSCFTISGVASLIAAAIFVSGIDLWSPAISFIRQNTIFYLVFIAFTMLSTLSHLMDATFIAKRRTGFVLLKHTIHSLIKLPLPILLVLFFHSFGIVASWGIALGIALVISFFVFLPRIQLLYKPIPTLNLTPLKNMVQYSGGNYLASILSSMPVIVLPLMIVNILGPDHNAYFFIAWTISSILYAIPGAVSRSLFAEGSHANENFSKNVTKSIKFTYLLLVPAVLILILAGKWILLVFGQNYSSNGLKLLWFLSLSGIPISIVSIYISILRVRHKINEVIRIQAFEATAILVASYLIIPFSGIIGIGYIWLGVHGAIAIYVLLTLRLRYSSYIS